MTVPGRFVLHAAGQKSYYCPNSVVIVVMSEKSTVPRVKNQ
jgi:hypothetical protein